MNHAGNVRRAKQSLMPCPARLTLCRGLICEHNRSLCFRRLRVVSRVVTSIRMKSPLPLFLLALAALSFAPARAATPPARPPNVIFILIDDWGWTDGACFGSKFYETPNFDRLAAEGMKFTQAYSACTVCSPTRAAVMTGKYPARLHITDWIAGHRRPYAKLRIPNWTMQLP